MHYWAARRAANNASRNHIRFSACFISASGGRALLQARGRWLLTDVTRLNLFEVARAAFFSKY